MQGRRSQQLELVPPNPEIEQYFWELRKSAVFVPLPLSSQFTDSESSDLEEVQEDMAANANHTLKELAAPDLDATPLCIEYDNVEAPPSLEAAAGYGSSIIMPPSCRRCRLHHVPKSQLSAQSSASMCSSHYTNSSRCWLSLTVLNRRLSLSLPSPVPCPEQRRRRAIPSRRRLSLTALPSSGSQQPVLFRPPRPPPRRPLPSPSPTPSNPRRRRDALAPKSSSVQIVICSSPPKPPHEPSHILSPPLPSCIRPLLSIRHQAQPTRSVLKKRDAELKKQED
ncbi:hypothetical protein M0R45_026029 [Rubus argutus]|uniref:Uncharacterized protein n=1 Tax=Rubus argutus TaxID=59490 RepID=A0AAW1WW57_RUBAR